MNKSSNGQESEAGLRKLSASAALIRATLEGPQAFRRGGVSSPELRIKPDGDFEAWVEVQGVPVKLFEVWPNKFGELAFGFACDHFKMRHEERWAAMAAGARSAGCALPACSAELFGVDSDRGLSEAAPERMTAPALMALCRRMAGSPDWLIGALDDLEKGYPMPKMPKGALKTKSSP